jgi:NAD(P)-dependent dehydrogenase (short-subunit alcohol dehydrogenase family)
LANRVALITGGAGGIGAATARALAARGCRVGITYLDRREAAERLASEIGGLAFPFDLRQRAQVATLVEAVERELGAVEILVHNAGLIRDRLLPFLAEEDWDEVQDVNLKGAYRLTKALIKGMLGRRWGRVIAVTSVSGVIGQLGQTHYSAAKAGLIGFVKALARECAPYSVTANAVAPGFIDTELLRSMPPKKLAEYVEGIPLRRLGRPEEVAELIAYLASDAAGYLTGQTIRIDGGLVMG